MIRSTYRNWSDHTDQVPVIYNIPKPFKKHFNEEDLFKADCKTFGSLIGQLTNHGTSIIALMADNRDDPEKLELLNDRLRMVCAGQSKQIDYQSSYTEMYK